MAKLFGCPINVEAEEEDGVGSSSSITREFFRSGNQPPNEATSFSAGLPPVNQRETNQYFRFVESNSDSGSVSMESESDLHHCFIDFFDRESYISSNQRLITSRDFNLWGFQDVEAEEIELGLRIGSGSGSGSDDSGGLALQVMEIDSSRVELDSGRVETETGRVETETSRVVTETGRVEVETVPTLAEIVADPSSLEEGVNWLGEEPMDYHNQEDDEPMNPDWDFGFFDVLFEDLFDFLPVTYELAENHLAYEEVLARTFDESGVNGRPPASKRVVDELPDVDITSEELSIGCAICKDEIVVAEKVKRLPCRHYYHGECIVPWLGIRNTCPVCRYELPTDDLEYERNRKSQRRGSSGVAGDLMSE